MPRTNSSCRINRRRAKILARRRATKRRALKATRTSLETTNDSPPCRSYEVASQDVRRECSFCSSDDALIVYDLRESPRLQVEPRKLSLVAPARKRGTDESFPQYLQAMRFLLFQHRTTPSGAILAVELFRK